MTGPSDAQGIIQLQERVIIRLRAALLAAGKTVSDVDRIATDGDRDLFHKAAPDPSENRTLVIAHDFQEESPPELHVVPKSGIRRGGAPIVRNLLYAKWPDGMHEADIARELMPLYDGMRRAKKEARIRQVLNNLRLKGEIVEAPRKGFWTATNAMRTPAFQKPLVGAKP